ncbi:MAG TPA: FG-GAP-like repeat-containing protein [Edaphobacter sp.]|nr:FG-GAP-like repeat-containing protein [Edaphobacter sp.]
MHRFLSFCLLTLTAATLPAETFRNPYRIPTPSDPASVIVADFNGDGLPDIIYGDNAFPPASLHILLAQPGGGYAPATTLALPSNVYSRCRAFDANRDGKQDLVCPYANTFSGSLVTFLGNGDGTFATPTFTPLPTSLGNYFDPYIYAPSDLNSDGVPDLMVLDANDQQTYILLGDGHGSFALASTIDTSLSAIAIDVNGDGKPDLLFNEGPYVMLGNGDGTFAPFKSYSQTFDYDNVCTYADMDGDGHVDAVCGYVETITGDIDGATHLIILHGNADGSFNPTPISDQVFGNHDTQYDGEGSFLFPLLVSDLNHDGIPDIIAQAGDGFTVLLGQPNLNFTDPKHYVAASTGLVATASLGAFNYQQIVDINNDGQLDIIAAANNGLYISYGKPDGTFDTAPAYEVAQVLGHATFADFNGDGVPDIAATGDTTIEISLGNGDGTFAPYKPLANANINFSTPLSSWNAYILHGDFDGDGHQDLLAIGSPSIYQYNSYIYFGHGDGTFGPLTPVPNSSTVFPQAYYGKVVDLNGDGRDDILSSDINGTSVGNYSYIYVGLSNGDGTFRPITTRMPTEPWQNGYTAANSSLALADFNHDGKLDAAFGALANAYVLNGHGDGSFDSTGTVLPIPSIAGTTSMGTAAVATGDFDGDGNQDVAVLYRLGNVSSLSNPYVVTNGAAVFVYYGVGDGTFSAPVTAGIFSHSYSAITASDLNGDGRADLILRGDNSPYELPALAVVHSMPGRSFGSELNYLAGQGLADLAAIDVNRDGRPDILVTNGVGSGYAANSVAVLLNQDDVPVVSGTLTSNPNPSTVGQPFTLTATLAPPPPSTATLAGLIQFAIDGIDAGSATLSSNAATITAPSTLSIGTHTATATWFGNSTYPAITLTATHTVEGIPVTLNLTSSLNPAAVGQAVVLSAAVANSPTDPPSTPTPTGTLTFTDNGTPLGTPVSITGGGTSSWSLLKGFSTGGKHIIVVTYSGDAIHSPATATLTEIVTALPTTTVLQSSLNPSPAGQPVTFTATITAQPENSVTGPFQTSTVTFTGLPGGPITRPVTFSSQDTPAAPVIGTATYTTNTLLPGTYTITAAFSGNPSFNPSTSATLTQVVTSALTTTTLTATPNPAYVTQTVTLSATVNSPIGTPTGTVQFFDGTTPLATVPLASGNATFATALLTPGDHTITAQYSGDTNNLPSTSSPITETILPSDFTLSIDPSSLTLITGHHTTLTLTATSVGSFADTIHLTIGSLPQWTTVTFTPADLTLTPGAKATTKLYVDTDAVIGYISQSQPKRNPFSTAIAATLALILLPLTNRRTRRLPTLIALAITATLLIGATGCSGMYPGSTAPGTYTLQITATGKQTPITHTLNLPLTVTK